VYAPFETVLKPLWVETPNLCEELRSHIANAAEIAQSLNSQVLAVLVKASAQRSIVEQRLRLLGNLNSAADVAASYGLTIGIEPLPVIPGMLVSNYDEAYALVQSLNHSNLKLIFDTGHAYSTDTSVLDLFTHMYDDICLLQLADQPGRLDPGSGKIDFLSLLTRANEKRYRGLVDLEYDWSMDGIAGEMAGLDRLKGLDRAAHDAAYHERDDF
jgi:hydroxypyruvate isomerase